MKAASLADLPGDWATPPVYARFSVQLGKMLDEKRITGTHLAPYLRNIDVQWSYVNTVDLPEMDFNQEDRERYSLRQGDLLVCEGGEVGRTCIWDGRIFECYFQKALHRLRPRTPNDEPRFFRYFMWMAVNSGMFAETTASTIQHLTAEKLRIVRYPCPSIERQRAIADYLDRETARLDGLVAAKERVLGLLAEKRRALITRAVTRGLDPRVPLRDSGIPWLGDIPAHWKTKRAKWMFTERDERSTTGEETLLSLRMERGLVPHNDVSDKQTRPEELIGYKKTSIGEIVVNRMRASSGLIAITPQDGLVSPDYAVFRVSSVADPRYFTYLFTTELLQAVFRSESTGLGTGSAGFLRLYSENFLALWFPFPPKHEQREIVAHIAKETAKLDALRAATERTIALLKERRAALIAAAVTGKIDVNGLGTGL